MVSTLKSGSFGALLYLFPGLVLSIGLMLCDIQHVKSQDVQQQRYEFEHPQMGTLFRFVLYAPDKQSAKTAADSAFKRIDSLNNIMSDYLNNSELNRLVKNSGDGNYVDVSSDLFHVISTAQILSRQTEGAFDITIGPYVQLWRKMNRQDSPAFPDKNTLDKAGQSVGYQYVNIDSSYKRIALNKPNMKLDLGGIAKGYAADEALKVLQFYGIKSALIDAGGDITAGEAPPDEKGWHITIPHPSDEGLNYLKLILSNQAIATSGDMFQFVEIDGKRYSHIIDPETGLGITTQSTVTVIAPSGITADSYASALSVLGPSRGIQFIRQHSDIHARFVYKKNNSIQINESSGFQKLLTKFSKEK